jgi:hypothetical protein
MSDSVKRWTGGCLCGVLRYEAEGEPLFAGLCCCTDCRKASGSGFIPFLGFSSGAVRFTGRAQTFTSKAASGKDAVRNFCPDCGKDDQFTIYAGTLDDPSTFHPTMAIFTRDRPAWAVLPAGLKTFEKMPPG